MSHTNEQSGSCTLATPSPRDRDAPHFILPHKLSLAAISPRTLLAHMRQHTYALCALLPSARCGIQDARAQSRALTRLWLFLSWLCAGGVRACVLGGKNKHVVGVPPCAWNGGHAHHSRVRPPGGALQDHPLPQRRRLPCNAGRRPLQQLRRQQLECC